jgi:diamine N-acetyltransferase
MGNRDHWLVPEVVLREVTSENWRAVAAVAPKPEQSAHVMPVTYYLCLCHYGAVWHPLAVSCDDAVAGFVMWGVDETDGSHWIGGLVIEAGRQQHGIGRATVESLVRRLAESQNARRFALSYSLSNTVARDLYARLGFRETGEVEDDELVARLELPPRTERV